MKTIKGIVEIPNCGLYAKTPKALEALFSELRKKGYNIKDCGKEKDRPSRKIQEKEGWYLWFASLRKDVCQRVGKCGSCNSYTTVRGIQSHKHECDKCGAYTYLEYVDGTIIRFKFVSDEDQAFEPTLQMKVFDYDDELGCLLLYPVPEDGNDFNDWSVDKAMAVLERNKDKFIHVERNGDFLAVRYNPYSSYIEKDAVISVYETRGHKWNHKVVKLYQGKEYGEFDNLPLPESYTIYEAWHWIPLKPSPKLHEKIIQAAGMVSDCGYYYQDGRAAFSGIHLERMRLFVEHFTTLNLEKWDKMIVVASKSGPGIIKAVANFCSENPEIKNRPNVGNILVGVGKAFSGGHLTEDEMEAMADALKDPEESSKFFDVFRRR